MDFEHTSYTKEKKKGERMPQNGRWKEGHGSDGPQKLGDGCASVNATPA